VWPASTAFPPGPTFIQKLDAYLDLVRNPRPSTEAPDSSDDAIIPELYGSPLQRGDLVEIQGPSGSGKTSLILFFIMITILPETYETGKSHGEVGGKIKVEIGGKGHRVALLYLESALAQIDKLKKGMDAHLEQCFRSAGMGSPSNQKKAVDDIVQAALGRLILLKIPSPSNGLDLDTTSSPWAGFCSGLRSLLFYAKQRAEGEIALVVIDGLGDPYWQARWYKDQQTKQARTSKGTTTGTISHNA
jgi:energy-coupling factor transporter ATP-binding protein EcfA2